MCDKRNATARRNREWFRFFHAGTNSGESGTRIMSIAVRPQWLSDTVRECQAMVGLCLHPRARPMSQVFDEFLEGLPHPESQLEVLTLKGLLLELCLRWGNVDHRLFHRVYGDNERPCRFAPTDTVTFAWFDPNTDPAALFRKWAAHYARGFQRAHPLHSAVELRIALDGGFHKKHDLIRFAKLHAVSLRTLRSEFLKLTGTTVLKYQTTRRVEAAIGMLRSSHDKVHVIAQAVGWASRKDLNRAMIESTGMTPVVVRRLAHRDKQSG